MELSSQDFVTLLLCRYLKHIVIKEMETGKHFIFLNNRWLAVDKDDGQVEREIPVASDTELKDFTTLFKNKIERDLWDGNIWFSVFGRPVRSNFTRVQRASCCLCLLYCTMLANIMFFGAAEADTNTISFMGIELSWTQVKIYAPISLFTTSVQIKRQNG